MQIVKRSHIKSKSINTEKNKNKLGHVLNNYNEKIILLLVTDLVVEW